ncbi:MAG: DNA repair protein RadA [Phascolarctobacterium sp.]|nr:DNA repair protein RadA [Phascolarctobacterium sp.]
MAKTKYRFVCQSCGYVTAKWLGKCPECGAWDSLVEEAEVTTKSRSFLPIEGAEKIKPKTIASVSQVNLERLTTGIREFDRVLGGGVVPGSLVLLGGTPGIGKSTMLLDAGLRYGKKGIKVLYVSGEESEEQTAMRAARLGNSTENLLIMTATDLDAILIQAQNVNPKLLIIDSIQTMYNAELQTAAGSVGQVRECTAKLLQFAKTTGIAVLLIGHVTKDGTIAGPRLLEHMVDVVLQFEGDRSYSFRVLRALKNRFGSTNESGIFSMEAGGLQEVANPAGLFLEDREHEVSGSVITACMEGNRPILTEIQSLVAKTPFGMPRRTAVGFDYNRVNMLIAILERHFGLDFGTSDAYVNVVGGMKLTEPAGDLAVATALVSSLRSLPIAKDTLVFGEIGLTGEVRRVSAPERRIQDAINLGFKKFIVPYSKLQLSIPQGIEIVRVKTVTQAFHALFAKTKN